MNRTPRGRGQGGGRPQGPPAGLGQNAVESILGGDAGMLVSVARESARGLRGDDTSRTSLRKLYGEALRIQMLWNSGRGQEASRRLTLLRPRLAYQAARNRKLGSLRDELEPLVSAVGNDRQRFQHFMEFFEALVAYSR